MKKFALMFALMVIMTITVGAKTTGVSFEEMASKRPKEGVHEQDGNLYVYKHGKVQTGYFTYRGKHYYGHLTSTEKYPKGSVTRGEMRIRSDRWYAYGGNGAMYMENKYHRKGPIRRILELEIDKKTHAVKYVYNISAGRRGWRYSTKEMRYQREQEFGNWKTVEGMQFIPDWVDMQR